MSSKNASKCVVTGCSSKGVVCHRFPNPKTNMTRLVDWMKIVGLDKQNCYDVYAKKVICAVHFTADCSSPGTKRLNANSYPSLNLPFHHSHSKPTCTSNDDDNTPVFNHSHSTPTCTSNDVDNTPVFNDVVRPSSHSMNDSMMSGFDVLDKSSVEPDQIAENVEVSNSGNAKKLHGKHAKTTARKPKTGTDLLKKIGVAHCSRLTPNCRKLYKVTNLLLKQSRRNMNRNNLFKTRLRDAEKFNDKYLVSRLSPKTTAAASLFMQLQVRETIKCSRGRRLNLDEKMLSLSLYKRSPKCYRMLAKLFTLPSKRTLNNILSSVRILPGICPLMMKVLKDNVQNLKPSERYCSILFDEVCLSSGLTYNTVTDEIDGFVNTGHSKNQNIADHALVFMVRGIKKKFKQPIMYTFCKGATHQYEIICQLKKVIEAVHLTGLRVVATISDQGTANVGAINILNNETRLYHVKNNSEYYDEFYEVELHDKQRLKLVHIYDVPHLMKCIRNNLLTKNLSYTIDNKTKYAKWSHLEDLYNIDSAVPDCKMLPRLTDQHIVRDKIAKMKVKYATQVFSQRVSSTMNFLASRNIIGTDAADTAYICLFFDKLFDSLNGSFDKVTDGKIYRTAVKKNSIHHTVWAESLKVLSTMSFILENGRKKSVPTIKNWMTTIRSFQTLSKVLDLNGIRSFLPRHLNQDPLECFFGAIRSIGSPNPNCHAFASAYKTLVLNNLVSTHSPGSNCEEDFTEGSLSSFKNFFESAISSTPELENQIVISADLPPTLHNLSMTTSFVRGQAQNYIAGFIVKKLNKTFFKNCQTCLAQLCTEKVSEHHSLITAREYQSNHPTLKYPSSTLCSIVQQIISFVGEKMSNVCLHPNIHSTLTNALNQQLIFPFELNCSEHKDLFWLNIIKFTIKMMIQHYCTEVNRILLGKRQLQDNETDPVKKLAYTWYLKHSKTRKTQGKFNLI